MRSATVPHLDGTLSETRDYYRFLEAFEKQSVVREGHLGATAPNLESLNGEGDGEQRD